MRWIDFCILYTQIITNNFVVSYYLVNEYQTKELKEEKEKRTRKNNRVCVKHCSSHVIYVLIFFALLSSCIRLFLCIITSTRFPRIIIIIIINFVPFFAAAATLPLV